VASLARNDSVDVIVEVPGEVVGYARPGRTLDVKVGGAETKGTVVAVVPRGDIATRTFPVKVRVRNRYSLIEGMEARVSVPTGKSVLTLLVSRDAVVTVSGNTAVYAVEDGKAKMVPVKVLQYEGGNAGIEGNGLRKGMTVVVKGNERLRDGQPVRVVTGQGTVSGSGEQGGPPR
jgi:multidrug efflux pump subunit AcrA (membrane-fusion protein)